MNFNIFKTAELIAFFITTYLTIDIGFKLYNYKKYTRIFPFYAYCNTYDAIGRKKLNTIIKIQQSAPNMSDRNCPFMFSKILWEICNKKYSMEKENLIELEERIKKGEFNRKYIGDRYE